MTRIVKDSSTERGLSLLQLCDTIGGLVEEEAAASN